MKKAGKPNAIWILLLLLFAAVLRIYDLGGKSLWYDELYELQVAGKNIFYIIRVLHPLHSPLNQLISHLFLKLGSGEFFLRLPAAFWGIFGVWAIYRLGYVLFGRREGLLSAFLLTISSYHLRYSQEGRMYALFALVSILSTYFFWQAGKDNRKANWIGYVVFSTLALYTHLFALFLILSQAVFYFLPASVRRFRPSPPPVPRRNLTFSFCLLAVGILFLPRVIVVLSHPDVLKMYLKFGGGEALPPEVRLTPVEIILGLYGAGSGFPLYYYLFFFFAGMAASIKRQLGPLVFLLLIILLPFAGLRLFKPGHIFNPRYLIFLLPAYYLLIARGVRGVAEGLGGLLSGMIVSSRLRLTDSLALVFCAGFLLLDIKPLTNYYANLDPAGRLIKADWKGAVEFLEKAARPGDAVIPAGSEAYYSRLALNYYLPRALKKTLYDLKPGILKEAGIWWIGQGVSIRPLSEEFSPRQVEEKVAGIEIWRAVAPVRFSRQEIVNPALAVDEGVDYGSGNKIKGDGIPDGWEAIDYQGDLESNYAFFIDGENGYNTGKSFCLRDNIARPSFLLQSAKIPVRGERRFWISVYIKGAELYLEWFSPYLGVQFYDEKLDPLEAPEQGLRTLVNKAKGWGLCTINGLTPPRARYLRLQLVENKGYCGKVSKFNQVRLYGDW